MEKYEVGLESFRIRKIDCESRSDSFKSFQIIFQKIVLDWATFLVSKFEPKKVGTLSFENFPFI